MWHTRGMVKPPKRPRDFAQLGKLMVDMAIGAIPNDSPKEQEPETRAAMAGRKGGLRGGKARAAKLSPRKRRQIARRAAAARWEKSGKIYDPLGEAGHDE